MKKRLYIFIAAVIAVATLGIGLTAVPAHAATTYELKTDNGDSSLCMNRYQDKVVYGTPVIAYNCGYSNNDFYVAPLTTMCGSGTVTETCPFTVGSGLNADLDGDKIGTIYAYNEKNCVGGSSASDQSAKLEPCPPDNGEGGGDSTIVVEAYSRGTDPAYYVLVSRNFSDQTYALGHCSGWQCAMVTYGGGYDDPLDLSQPDSEVQGGHPQDAAGENVWGEISS